MNRPLLLVVLFTLTVTAACTTPSPVIPEAKLRLKCPVTTDTGKKVSIFIKNAGDPADPLQRVSLIIDSNPEQHREALTAVIQGPYPVSNINIYVRVSGDGTARLRALGVFQSGRTETAACSFAFTNGVSFDDIATLVDPDPNSPISPVGKQLLRVKRHGDSNTVSVASILLHPMRPGAESELLNDVSVVYRDTEIVHLTLGDSIATNPFLGVAFMDGQVGKARVIWRNTAGKAYEMEQ
jgi:predicted secreted protein